VPLLFSKGTFFIFYIEYSNTWKVDIIARSRLRGVEISYKGLASGLAAKASEREPPFMKKQNKSVRDIGEFKNSE
jgi:hypothetical protein